MSVMNTFTKGIIKENPTLKFVLGMCPALAVTTSAYNGIGMGIAATFVLFGSNSVISIFRKSIPDKVRIPAFITIIAGFVTIVQLLMRAYVPALNQALGIFIPLMVVNCVILARAELFASKNKVFLSVLDALGMGLGFTLALFIIGSVREVLGAGMWFGIDLTFGVLKPALIMILPPGGFLVFGFIMATVNRLTEYRISQKSCNTCSLPCANASGKKVAL